MTDHLEPLRRWLTHPDGGGYFTRQRDAIHAPDPTCPALKHAWLPRKGGVSCPGDLVVCDGGCGVTFFWEGMWAAFDDCPESDHYYCACCLSKADHCPCTPNRTGDQK